jgi:tetratricopeptide (TPR) repeat protein
MEPIREEIRDALDFSDANSVDNDDVDSEPDRSERLKRESDKAKDEGNALFGKGNYPGAVSKYTEALQLCGSNAVAAANRAMAHTKLENWRQVVVDCCTALSIDPSYAKAYSRRAVAYERLAFMAKALADYEHARTLLSHVGAHRLHFDKQIERIRALVEERERSATTTKDDDDVVHRTTTVGASNALLEPISVKRLRADNVKEPLKSLAIEQVQSSSASSSSSSSPVSNVALCATDVAIRLPESIASMHEFERCWIDVKATGFAQRHVDALWRLIDPAHYTRVFADMMSFDVANSWFACMQRLRASGVAIDQHVAAMRSVARIDFFFLKWHLLGDQESD